MLLMTVVVAVECLFFCDFVCACFTVCSCVRVGAVFPACQPGRARSHQHLCVCVLEPGYEYVLLMQDAWKK